MEPGPNVKFKGVVIVPCRTIVEFVVNPAETVILWAARITKNVPAAGAAPEATAACFLKAAPATLTNAGYARVKEFTVGIAETIPMKLLALSNKASLTAIDEAVAFVPAVLPAVVVILPVPAIRSAQDAAALRLPLAKLTFCP